jgi:hypothetical protein
MLLPFYRQMSLIRQRNSLQKQLMDEKQKLYDLQSYAATLGQGRLTMASVASLPASVFSDGVAFMGMSNQMALMEAQQKFSIFQQSGMMQMQGQTPAQQQQMQRYYFNCFAEQAYQNARKAKETELNKMEKEIDLRTARIEQRLQAVNAELDSVKGAVDKDAQNAPRYA